jgi:hypothetical protein
MRIDGSDRLVLLQANSCEAGASPIPYAKKFEMNDK